MQNIHASILDSESLLFVTLALFAVFSAGRSFPQSVQTQTYTVVSGVSYAHSDGVDLLADLYLPKGAGPFPAILFIHGGGWSSGDRRQLHRLAEAMAEHGEIGMCIEYRLAPRYPYPAGLQDSKEALLWLRAHAETYHVAQDRVAVIGSSAGGYLAAMIGLDSAAGSPSGTSVQAVVVLNGIFDLQAMPQTPMISDFLGNSCPAIPQLCSEASPRSHVRQNAPPFLVMHGNADKIAPYSQATGFVDALRSAGNQPEFYTAEGGPHTFWAKPAWSNLAMTQVLSFLNRQFIPSVPLKAGPK